jgi:DNA-binding LacI/PurR family transcriptional regulator
MDYRPLKRHNATALSDVTAQTFQQTPRMGVLTMARRSSATLRDIAERVGVSVSAVSMALADHPRIGAETKSRVLRAADELGYVTNAAGRALRVNRVGAIALIVPNTSQHVFGHSYFLHVLTGVDEAANQADVQLLLSTNPDEVHGEVAYDRVMRAGWVDGAIVTSAAVDDPGIRNLVSNGMPVVLLGRFPDLPDAVSVGIDDVAASHDATEHLITVHGRRRLVHLSGPLNHRSAMDRRDGFVDACRAHGVEPVVLEGDYSEESGVRAGEALDPTSLDGLVAANDEMAFGAMTALAARGVHVPRDVAVIGFDDFGLSRVTTPSISTVHVPTVDMAAQATRLLLALIAGERPAEAHAVVPVHLVLRQSCGCRPSTPSAT